MDLREEVSNLSTSKISSVFKKYADIVIAEKNWKFFAVVAAISFAVFVLLDSILVLIKIILFVAFVGTALRAVYLAYPKFFKN